MPEHRDIVQLPQGQVSYTIKDVANIILQSASLTGVLIRVITRVAKDLLLEGIKEIGVTIESIKDTIVVTIDDGNRRRKQIHLAHTIVDYSNEIRRVESLPPGSIKDKHIALWLDKLEELMNREIESIV